MRQHDDCPGMGRSVRCETVDEQAGELFGSLSLPRDWRAEIERRVADYERVRSLAEERGLLTERLRRLTAAYTMGNLDDEDYKRQQADIKVRIADLRIPEAEEALSAGEVLLTCGCSGVTPPCRSGMTSLRARSSGSTSISYPAAW
jgi:hypothetical protein